MSIYEGFNWGKSVIEHPMSAGDHTGWAVAGTGADAVTLMQSLATDGAKALQNARLAKAAATPIIRYGLLTMMGMSNATGIGEPETGDRFAQGAEGFKAVSDALGSTKPPASWQGNASDAYADQNQEQEQRADTMAEIDQTVKEVLDNEAHQVDVARKMLDRCQTVLSLSIPAAIAAKLLPGGAAISIGIQSAAVGGTMPFALERFRGLAQNAARNATEIRRAGASYDDIASGAQPS